jgi:hypothetical protein
MSEIYKGEHAPKTSEEIKTAARDLLASGHTDYDIAEILRIDVSFIRRLLGMRALLALRVER